MAVLKIHIFKFNKYCQWIPESIRDRILAPVLDKFIISRCGVPDLVLSNALPSDSILCHSKLNVYLLIHGAVDANHYSTEKVYTKKPVVCVSQGVKTGFDKFFNSQFPSYYIYNSVDVDYIKQQADEFKPKYCNYLVHVGRFEMKKRHDILIRAYQLSGVEAPLLLVGKGSLQKRYTKLVDDLGLNKKVIFIGLQSNPYPFIKNAKLMILSSSHEGFGMVIIESIALGTPVISTNCHSGPDEILPKNNLVPVNNVQQLANKINDAMKYPTKYTTDLKKDFILENQVKKYLELIKS